jgi:uncharacterized membrane protein YphA (DoxX/SURF4 family)
MKFTTGLSRILVGTIFVVSGLIKANDPHGFSYKLEEYFQVFSDAVGSKQVAQTREPAAWELLDCPKLKKPAVDYNSEPIPPEDQSSMAKSLITLFRFCEKHALFLSVLISVLEIVLGFLVVAGFRMVTVSWFLMGMILFFLFLTFYSAYYNKVTDCGCFGDALKLTPWQSFWKDVILLILILPLFIARKSINGLTKSRSEHVISGASVLLMVVLSTLVFDWFFPILFLGILVAAKVLLTDKFRVPVREFLLVSLVTIGSSWFAGHCISHLPVKDYRPWKIGNHIPKLTEGRTEVAEVTMVYIENATCKLVYQPTTEWSWLDSTFEATHTFYKQDKKVKIPAESAKVKDFSLEDPETGESLASSLLNFPGYAFLFISTNLEEADRSKMELVRSISEFAASNHMMFLGATNTNYEIAEEFRHEFQLMFPILQNDVIALKTIIRSNPGLVLLQNGTVVAKWHYNDFPSLETLKNKYLK